MTTNLSRLTLVVVWITVVAACSPLGEPPAKAWAVDVSSMRYSTSAFVGGTLTVTATLTNTGAAANPGLTFQFSDLDDYADIVGCTPDCATDAGLGALYARFAAGVAPGASATYEFEFIPTKVGAVHWQGCVYDDDDGGDQVYCGDATTTIR